MANIWPYVSKFAVPAESQIQEGGGPWPNDAYWNCVFACVSVALQTYGYPDIEPEDLRQLVQPGSHAGADFNRVRAFLQAHPERWPNLPRIETGNPNDTIAAFDEYLNQGFLCIFDAWDDGNGNLLNHKPPQGYSHACILEAQGATKTTVWNPWHGEQAGQTFDKVWMRAATLGGSGNVMVFARSVAPAAPVAPPAPAPIPPPVVAPAPPSPPQPPAPVPVPPSPAPAPEPVQPPPVPPHPDPTTHPDPHSPEFWTWLMTWLQSLFAKK